MLTSLGEMADPTTQDRRLTGDEILSELLRNAEAGVFKIRYTALLPCIFHVYLHPEDFHSIRAAISALRSEAIRSLASRLEELNAKAGAPALVRMLGLEAGERMQYKILEPDWIVDFHSDQEQRLQKGDIEIYSELGSEPRLDLGDGAKTTLITRRDSEGHTSTRQAPAPSAGTAVVATIRYEENGVARTFEMTKDVIVVGRGGRTHWVDLKLEAPPDVSREHCRIRRDAETRQFYLTDSSQFGTTVDGVAVQGEVRLPGRARIGLADLVFLEFESA